MKKAEKTEKTEKTEKNVTLPKSKIAGSTPGLTQADIQACLDHAQAIAKVLAPYAVTLTTVQRRAQTKFRKEGDTVIPTLARLATESGLASAALDVDTMQKQAELAGMLIPLHTSLKTLSDTVGDTVLSAHGDSWHTATTLHGALVRVATRNPGLRRDMEVVSGAFTNRKKAAASPAAGSTAESAPVTPSNPQEPTAPAATTAAAPPKGP
jgi:hypothetical protein